MTRCIEDVLVAMLPCRLNHHTSNMQDEHLCLKNAIPTKHAKSRIKSKIPVWKDRGIVHALSRIDFFARGDRESSARTQYVRYTTNQHTSTRDN